MSLRFKLCLSVWVAVVAGTMFHQRAAGGESELVPMPVPMATKTSLTAADENPALTPVPAGQADPSAAQAPAGESAAEADANSAVTPDVSAAPSVATPNNPSLPVPATQFQPQPLQMPPYGISPYGVQSPGMFQYAVPQFGIPQPPTPDEGWHIDIRPSAKIVVERHYPDLPADEHIDAAEVPCEACGHNQADPQRYLRIYSTIPFNRAEYGVNPSYRHDATMEILTGNARHQTIVRHTSASSRPVTTRPRVPQYNPYQYGYLRPALRLNYYRHFPSLNPYVNIWNLSGAY